MINVEKKELNFGDNNNQQCQNNNIGYNESIFSFNNLASNFSSATVSYVIDDFSIFNSYRHNNLNIIK
jgi:hypothetical protein